jgi:hypothetical protein
VVLSLTACAGGRDVAARSDQAPSPNQSEASDGEGRRPRAAMEWVPEEHLNDIAGAAPALEEEAVKRWPDEFAGLWIDRRTIVVAFTEGAEEKAAELRQAIEQPFPVIAADAERTVDELRDLQQTMIAHRADLGRGDHPSDMPAAMVETRGHYDLGIDIQTGVVTVHVERLSPELQAAFGEYYGAELIRVEEGMAQPLD